MSTRAASGAERHVAHHRGSRRKRAVLGTPAGTGPLGIKHCLGRPRGECTWGTGAFLLAGARLRQMGLVKR